MHTGDIGMWLPNGSLRIIDRKNNLFKLAQADFVSPEQIENTYLQHPLVKQVGCIQEFIPVLFRFSKIYQRPRNVTIWSFIKSHSDIMVSSEATLKPGQRRWKRVLGYDSLLLILADLPSWNLSHYQLFPKQS